MRSIVMRGSLVAIVTPMHEEGGLDLDRFRALIDFHVAEGTDGIVVVGTTGESPTVDFDEHRLLISAAVERAAGRVPVIAGTGANSTREAIDLSVYAKDAGADASLSVVPYYNKPTQEGLYQHFRAIAEAVDIPQILYNVPGRTVADMAMIRCCGLRRFPTLSASRMPPAIWGAALICCAGLRKIFRFIAEMMRVAWLYYCWVPTALFRSRPMLRQS